MSRYSIDVDTRVTGAEKLDALEKKINSLKKDTGKIPIDVVLSSNSNSGINKIKKEFQQLKNLANEIGKTKISIKGLDGNKNANQVTTLSAQMKSLQSRYDSLKASLNGKLSVGQLAELGQIASKATQKCDLLDAKAKDLQVSLANATKVSEANSGLEKVKKDYKELKSLASEIGKIKVTIKGLNESKNANQITTLSAMMGELQKKYDSLKTSLNGKLGTGQLAELDQIFAKSAQQCSLLTAKTDDLKASLAQSQKLKSAYTELKRLAAEISNADIAMTGLDTSRNINQISIIKSQTDEMRKQYDGLMDSFGKDLNESQLAELAQIFSSSTRECEILGAKAKDLKNSFNKIEANTAANKTLAWLKTNSKAAKEYGDILKSLADQQRNASNQLEYDDISQQIKNVQSEAAAKGLLGKAWTQELGNSVKKIGEFAGVYNLVRNVAFQVPQQIIQAVRDVDAAMIELRKVSDAPYSSITNYFDEAAESAKKYGATIDDVISSTADWSRLGYDLPDAKLLSDATTLIQKVGDNMTQESASEGLVSTLRGFKLEADQVNRINDVINEISNTQPISSDGLFAGLEKSASSLDAANNSLEQSVALITAANSVVQDPESVGTAYKTISMRIRGAKTELEEANLETDGMVESTAKLREEIMSLSGVDIMKDKD